MSVSISVQAVAQQLMKRFDAYMIEDHAPAIAELQAAGVAQHTIDSLYPFSLEDYEYFARTTLLAAGGVEALAPILGSHDLYQGFSSLPEEAAGRADKLEWLNSFFDVNDDLNDRSVAYPPETGINGNANYCKKQWGCVIVFLHECAICPSLPEHTCVPISHLLPDSCESVELGKSHTQEEGAAIFFQKWFAEYRQVAQEVLAALDAQVSAAGDTAMEEKQL